jgi:hypothetical protein
LAKGTEILAHKVTLLLAEIRTLRKVYKALSKRRRAKKTRVRQGGALTVEESLNIIAQKDVEELVRRDKRSTEGSQKEGQSTARHCNLCGITGHNTRICRDTIVVSTL